MKMKHNNEKGKENTLKSYISFKVHDHKLHEEAGVVAWV